MVELRQNTAALNKQAEELNASVEESRKQTEEMKGSIKLQKYDITQKTFDFYVGLMAVACADLCEWMTTNGHSPVSNWRSFRDGDWQVWFREVNKYFPISEEVKARLSHASDDNRPVHLANALLSIYSGLHTDLLDLDASTGLKSTLRSPIMQEFANNMLALSGESMEFQKDLLERLGNSFIDYKRDIEKLRKSLESNE